MFVNFLKFHAIHRGEQASPEVGACLGIGSEAQAELFSITSYEPQHCAREYAMFENATCKWTDAGIHASTCQYLILEFAHQVVARVPYVRQFVQHWDM